MAYLRAYDYTTKIQDVNLNQIITSNTDVRLITEQQAQDEVISYLSQKYDTDAEFTDTNVFDLSTTYKAKDRIELNFPVYVSTNNYSVNDLAVYSGNAYICINATTGTFTPANWTLLGKQYQLFYVTLPKPEFNYKSYYQKGDQVFWKDKTYTAQQNSPILDHETALQYGNITTLPIQNVFPDDAIAGVQYWGTGTAYSVASGTLPTNATKWTKGDNRSSLLVQKTVDICLFHMHSRIAPNNIPQLRSDRYAAATAWLQMASEGTVNANIPRLQPKKGARIVFGGQVRRQNDY